MNNHEYSNDAAYELHLYLNNGTNKLMIPHRYHIDHELTAYDLVMHFTDDGLIPDQSRLYREELDLVGWTSKPMPILGHEAISNSHTMSQNFGHFIKVGDTIRSLIENPLFTKQQVDDGEIHAVCAFAVWVRQGPERNEELMRKVGSIVKFGGLFWHVLTVQNNKALLLSNSILEQKAYHNVQTKITWEQCSLQKYLNDDFLNKFSQADRNRIAETRLSNPDNLWYCSTGGNETIDKIFLLSLEEVDCYFGDSGDYINIRRRDKDGKSTTSGHFLSNKSNLLRRAKIRGKASCAWWWLRSPSSNGINAAFVESDGSVNLFGGNLGDLAGQGGVRPALWLNL